jgi:hypothetical protein
VTSAEALEALDSGWIAGAPVDLQRVALVEAATDLGLPTRAEVERNQVQVVRSRAGEVEVATDSASAAVLVHSTNFAAGWEVTVDERACPLLRVDGLVQGVLLPSGSHVVRFHYRPGSFRLGSVLSLAGLALAAFVSSGHLRGRQYVRRPAVP